MLGQLNIGPVSLPLWGLLPILAVSVAIPVVLHLLSSVRAPQVYFSTLRFLRLSMEKTARRRRVQHWLLLVLRTLLIALLLLAVTQPLYKPRHGLAGGDAQLAAAIVVDNSLSMAAGDGPRRRLDTARNVAKDIIRGANKPRELALIFTNGRAGQAEPKLAHDLSAELRRLDSAEVGLGAASMVSAVQTAVDLVKQSSLPSRVVYVLSDMQSLSFTNLATCKGLTDNADLPLMVVDCGHGGSANLAVTDVEIKGQGRVVGATVWFEAVIANSSPETRRAKVGLEIDGRRQDHLNQTVLLTGHGASGSRQKVMFEFVFAQPGLHRGRVVIDEANDLLPDDDTREFALRIADRIRVLVITGPGGAGDPTGPGYYVMTALKVPSAVSAVANLLGEVKVAEIAENDVVVLCDVPSLDDALSEALRRFVADGGTLIIFAGPSVESASYNARLADSDNPLLPATLGEPVGDPVSRREASKLLRVDVDHPIFRELYDTQDNYQSVLVYCYLTTALHAVRPGRPIAWLDRDRPLLLERRYGQGRCLLFTTSANTVWTNLPTRPVFLPMLMRMCLGSISGADETGPYGEGSQVTLALRGDQPVDVDVVLPEDQAGRSATVRARSNPTEQGNTAVFTETFTRGTYAWQSLGKPAQTGQFVIAPDGAESDLTPISSQTLTDSLPDHPVCVAGNLDELRDAIHLAARGNPLWDYFLIVVLVITTVEAFLANRYRPGETNLPSQGPPAAAA
ncbi:MAG: VWA domain-containing protein [Phycisphaerae bacterium]|nr:VWA domain-containing protein [Phycisphaerae bacterium]